MPHQSEILEANILVVDNCETELRMISRIFEDQGYRNVAATHYESAGTNVADLANAEVILLGVSPETETSCLELLQQVKHAHTGMMPIAVIAGDCRAETRQVASALGVTAFLAKPICEVELINQSAQMLGARFAYKNLEKMNRNLEMMLGYRTRMIDDIQIDALERLAMIAEYREDKSGNHTRNVGELSSVLASHLGEPKDFVESIRIAARLHDIGKVGIPDSVLLKAGALDNNERAAMRHHSLIGATLLAGSRLPIFRLAEEIALTHHEWWDGTGYPHELKGEDIPISGRIVAIADAFDSLTQTRAYREAQPTEMAIQQIRGLAGKQFDPRIVDAFVEIIEFLDSDSA